MDCVGYIIGNVQAFIPTLGKHLMVCNFKYIMGDEERIRQKNIFCVSKIIRDKRSFKLFINYPKNNCFQKPEYKKKYIQMSSFFISRGF